MILRAEKLLKRFGDRVVLDAVSLEIDKGEVVALCGPSGSGKTTLVRIVAGLLNFDAGRLQLGDYLIAAGQPYPPTLFGKIGVVFQDHHLFPHMTALQNVELGLRLAQQMPKREARERALHQLDRVEMAERSGQYPASLSGGERQRVAIARALAMDPLLLLLDEPTSSLESARIGEVYRSIRRLSEAGITMLLVSHNLAFARRTATRYSVIENGAIRTSADPGLLDGLEGEWD